MAEIQNRGGLGHVNAVDVAKYTLYSSKHFKMLKRFRKEKNDPRVFPFPLLPVPAVTFFAIVRFQ